MGPGIGRSSQKSSFRNVGVILDQVCDRIASFETPKDRIDRQAGAANDGRSAQYLVVGNEVGIAGGTIGVCEARARASHTLEVEGNGFVEANFGEPGLGGKTTAADNRPDAPLARDGKIPEPLVVDRRQKWHRCKRQAAGQPTSQDIGHLFSVEDARLHRFLDELGRHARKMGRFVNGQFCRHNVSPIREDI